MEENKRIKRKLKFIKKKGDLYDAISLKKNATPDTFERKLAKTYTLVFSRLMYLFLVMQRRLKNSLTPVSRFKNAQEEIREYLGLPIDIYRTKDIAVKNRYKNLGIIYGNYNPQGKGVRPSIDDLKSDLEILLDFAETYKINEIYIDEFFLRRYVGKDFLKNYKQLYLSNIMEHNADNISSYLNIKTNQVGLKKIIDALYENEFDNSYIYSFKDRIKDEIINDAIYTFEADNDIKKLLNVVKSRLNMHINDDGVCKDRTYGKIIQNYELGGPYLRVTVYDSEGMFISKNIISLYNYLEIPDFSSLEERTERVSDTQEIDLISLLYLHLIGETPQEVRKSEDINSLYDYIYNKYQEKNKRIPWIKTPLERIGAEIPQFVVSFYSLIFSLVLYLLLKDVVPTIFPFRESFLDRYNSFFNAIDSLYETSSEFERNMINKLRQFVEKYLPKDMADEILGYANEQMEYDESALKKIAEVEYFYDVEEPVYFASEYASNGYYRNGGFDFYLREPTVSYSNIVDCKPLFQVKCPIPKSEFADLDEENMFHIPLYAYPVENDYALTKVIIKDEDDEEKYVIVDQEWVYYNLWDFTEEEKEILKSMENPFIYYVYGRYPDKFQINDNYIRYSHENPEDIKEAITSGLNLSEDATKDEINEAIGDKDYTKYPLYAPRKDMEELEYYEKIASLDAIDLDLAGILTTMGNEGYIYTVGYKNINNPEVITTDEAYVWVMSLDGEVIDFAENFVTLEENNQEETSEWERQDDENDKATTELEDREDAEREWETSEDSKIKEILDKISEWAKKYHVSYILVSILAVLIINHTFGRKIRLQIKFNKAYKVLDDENLASTYADLLKYIYGYESVPIKRTNQEMIDLIYKEFYSLSDEEVEELLASLKETIKTSDDSEHLKRCEELLKNIPFIKERRNELKTSAHKGLHLKRK